MPFFKKCAPRNAPMPSKSKIGPSKTRGSKMLIFPRFYSLLMNMSSRSFLTFTDLLFLMVIYFIIPKSVNYIVLLHILFSPSWQTMDITLKQNFFILPAKDRGAGNESPGVYYLCIKFSWQGLECIWNGCLIIS